MSARSRSTRLSSGSTSKRNYAEGLTSSDEDDEGLSRKKSKSKVKELSSDDDSEDAFVPEKKDKNGKAKPSKGKSRYAESDSGSSSEFVEEEEEEENEEDLEEDDSEEEKPSRGKKSPKGKGKAVASRASNGSTKMQSSYDEDGNEVIVMARAPTGKHLQDPIKNDREWFAAHKNIYDYIHANWLAFTDTCVEEMIDKADDTIAFMPAKDLVERIYRDVRFSNDKTPYKRHLSWCMSRNGKKGNFAKYYLALSANDKSGLHAGLYEASKEDLQAVREHIINKTGPGRRLRELVNDKIFIKNFGAPPKSKAYSGKRASLWGSEDELKRAPKVTFELVVTLIQSMLWSHRLDVLPMPLLLVVLELLALLSVALSLHFLLLEQQIHKHFLFAQINCNECDYKTTSFSSPSKSGRLIKKVAREPDFIEDEFGDDGEFDSEALLDATIAAEKDEEVRIKSSQSSSTATPKKPSGVASSQTSIPTKSPASIPSKQPTYSLNNTTASAYLTHGDARVEQETMDPECLKNIYKELSEEYGSGFVPPKHGCLDGWAKQGVLLLNACLTVEAHKAGSHHNKGWEPFTQTILRAIAEDAAKAPKASVKTSTIANMFGKAAEKQGVKPATVTPTSSNTEKHSSMILHNLHQKVLYFWHGDYQLQKRWQKRELQR
ncbi:hypothetical protein L7F22_009592 [Adiantum nelumboides]|nr:hypothetical protein [Adiantum nelumboides]